MITTMIGMVGLAAGFIGMFLVAVQFDPAFEERISSQAPAACRDRWVAENVSPFERWADPVTRLRAAAYLDAPAALAAVGGRRPVLAVAA